MRRLFEIFLIFFLLFPCRLFSQDPALESRKIMADSILSSRGELYLTIPANVRKSLLIDIPDLAPDRQTDSLIYFYVNSAQFQKIAAAGLDYETLTPPSMLAPVEMADNLDDVIAGLAYPTYQQYLDIMKRFRDSYPELCKIDTIGYSIAGRLILAARIQRGAYVEGNRPLVFYSSTMHGDEPLGFSLLIMLINEVLTKAESSPQISGMLDSLVLLINPLANPDGAYFQSELSLFGARRFNLNNIDLNRNFHDIKKSMSYNYSGLQKENLEMVKYMEKFRSNLSANFHTGAEILNYPWDSWVWSDTLVSLNRDKYPHADNTWFIEICKEYVDSARKLDPFYLKLYPEGYVIGSVWYTVTGGRQDFVTYNLRGREVTIELSVEKFPPASQILDFWAKNRSSLLNFIEEANYGLSGKVISSLDGEPILAKIEIPRKDKNESFVYSNGSTGKFYRYLSEDTYEVLISASGYYSKTVELQIVKNRRTEIEIELDPFRQEILVKTLPGNEGLEIQLMDDDSGSFTAELFTLTGMKLQVRIFEGSSGIINPPLSRGIYILKVKSENQSDSRLVFF